MLGDFVTHKKGFAFKSSSFSEQGVPVVKVTNFTESSVDLSGIVYVSESIAKENRAFKLNAGDIVVQTVGSWPNNPASVVGKVVKIPNELDQSLLNQNAVILRPLNELDKDFLFFLLKDQNFKNYIINTAQGAANQASITLDSIFRFQFFKPILNIQHKIAAILTAYDDQIETNKRRIALLEKMAEELYREWFVRMRFPGYQNTRFVKGVPEGWELVKTDDAFDFTGGGTPAKAVASYWSEGTVQWFTPSDITGSSGIFLTDSGEKCSEDGLAHSSAKLFPAYSIMMTSRATIGAIGINTTPACTNQGFITCIPNERYPLPYLYHWLKLAKPYFEQLCGGATFPELTKGTFKKLKILTPPKSLADSFAQLAGPLMQSIENTLAEHRILTQTRDLLLPRLISGKLPVEDLDIQLPPSMREEAG